MDVNAWEIGYVWWRVFVEVLIAGERIRIRRREIVIERRDSSDGWFWGAVRPGQHAGMEERQRSREYRRDNTTTGNAATRTTTWSTFGMPSCSRGHRCMVARSITPAQVLPDIARHPTRRLGGRCPVSGYHQGQYRRPCDSRFHACWTPVPSVQDRSPRWSIDCYCIEMK